MLIASFKGKVDTTFHHLMILMVAFKKFLNLWELFWTPGVLVLGGISSFPMQISPVPLQGDIPWITGLDWRDGSLCNLNVF
jgi:hypothetical protein